MENILLVLEQLQLTLEATSIILAGALEVVVHLLYVRHQIGQVGAFNSESLVLLDKANLNALHGFRVSRAVGHCKINSI